MVVFVIFFLLAIDLLTISKMHKMLAIWAR